MLLRPLRGLLGAFLNEPIPGILVTTERSMSIQRFTAAHELGHFSLDHQPSLDDESILRRMPSSPEPTADFQETEADSFAIAFMMPKWLILAHCTRQDWRVTDLRRPEVAYQLSLRMGASYEATCRTLVRYELITFADMQGLRQTEPRLLKTKLLVDFHPADYRRDVWLLTERDEGTRIDGSRNDLFVLRLTEHSNGGYVWNFDQLVASGFAIVKDERVAADTDVIGSPVVRQVTAAPELAARGHLLIEEFRPWQPSPSLTQLTLDIDLTGPEEEGLSRAERRRLLEAA
ncbi:ImmA/IrrE family metallo-endopeptidase [Sphingomonas paeninsulae]|uniref:ImmA/IrrE family metallo-endopeptidase n=1 Tax=Sphingomonas paeninsulae TaxID=2319844 RepID=UPI001EF1596F|nr:ImmA/IrrE family metallo-endopeptidase [Sphingomonas paeninsulae]